MPTPAWRAILLLTGAGIVATSPAAHGQWWWPQPRESSAPTWQPELFADYLSSGQPPHPAVPRIVAAEHDGASLGSGVLVDANGAQGLVVTNWHVVRDTRNAVLVQFPGGFQSAGTVIQQDETWDLAVIVVWRPPIPPIPLADSPPAIGAPLTIAGWGRGTFRAQTGPCTQYLSPGSGQPQELVELWAGARQGDSGGPILDANGRLAGVLFGQNEGRTIGSCCTRVRAILARVGSTGVPPMMALAASAPAAAPPGVFRPEPFIDQPLALPSSAIPPTDMGAGSLATSSATLPTVTDAVTTQRPGGEGPGAAIPTAARPVAGQTDFKAMLERLRTPDGRETALQAAGGLALAVLGLRALFGGRTRG